MGARMLPDRPQDGMSRLNSPLDARSRRYRVPVLIGVWFAQGRRTASRWFQAAGVVDDWQDHYCFLGSLGRKTGRVATQLLQIVLRRSPGLHVGPYVRIALDDTPTKRYGPEVEGAGQHHNPTPGPTGSKFLYGHVWVTLS